MLQYVDKTLHLNTTERITCYVVLCDCRGVKAYYARHDLTRPESAQYEIAVRCKSAGWIPTQDMTMAASMYVVSGPQ